MFWEASGTFVAGRQHQPTHNVPAYFYASLAFRILIPQLLTHLHVLGQACTRVSHVTVRFFFFFETFSLKTTFRNLLLLVWISVFLWITSVLLNLMPVCWLILLHSPKSSPELYGVWQTICEGSDCKHSQVCGPQCLCCNYSIPPLQYEGSQRQDEREWLCCVPIKLYL